MRKIFIGIAVLSLLVFLFGCEGDQVTSPQIQQEGMSEADTVMVEDPPPGTPTVYQFWIDRDSVAVWIPI